MCSDGMDGIKKRKEESSAVMQIYTSDNNNSQPVVEKTVIHRGGKRLNMKKAPCHVKSFDTIYISIRKNSITARKVKGKSYI